MSKSNNSGGGIRLSGILGVVFITLKLTGNIDWSWWWVLAPFWVPVAIVCIVVCIMLIVAYIVDYFYGRR